MSFFERYSFLLRYTTCFIVGFFTYAVITRYTKTPPLAFIETRHQGNYKFINPLVECESANFQLTPNFIDIKKDVESYIKTKLTDGSISHASLYYRDMNNGPWFGINEEEPFSPASLIKVPLLITYYKLAETDPSILQKNISIGNTYNHDNQNIRPATTLTPNKNYTVDQLLDQMIVYSDNQAYNLLLRNIDPTALSNTYTDLGINLDNSRDLSGNILSVRSYASFFRILYNSSYLSKDLSEKALKLLSQIDYKQGLIASVPPIVTISHKYGESSYDATGEKQLHDCGIVYLPKKPYLVCIMTRGKDFNSLSSVIKNISHIIYSNLTKT